MNQKAVIVIFERGIEGWASISGGYKHNWVHPAVTWIHQYAVDNGLNWRAQTIPYFTGPLLAAVTRHRRAMNLSKLIRAYSVKDWEIHIAAHSEGTATVLLALKLAGWPKIKSLHLLCGACDSNFARNGLNFALRLTIDCCTCYRANRDLAMKIEDTLLGLAMFGIAWNDLPMGLSGPMNVAAGLFGTKLFTHEWTTYGHSSCFEPACFDSTMKLIVSNM